MILVAGGVMMKENRLQFARFGSARVPLVRRLGLQLGLLRPFYTVL